MQIGTIFQIAALFGLSDFHQQANKSITLLGITQDIPKRLKILVHKSISHITVKKKMVHRFPISLAQATSVHNDDMPLPEIVHSKDLAEGNRPCKKSCPQRSLTPPHTLPRETTTIRAG
jgi:hypothetical protein